MPTQKLTPVLLALALAVFAGCQIWNPGGVTVTGKNDAFTVRAPDGWKYATSIGHDFTASKDGPILQQIWIEHRDLKDKDVLPNSKRTLAANLSAFELGEAVADDIRADHKLFALEMKESAPATIGDQEGFKITFSFRTEDKLRLSETVYGCISGGKLWLLRYRAPTRHYFDRDAATFAQTVSSFRFGKKS